MVFQKFYEIPKKSSISKAKEDELIVEKILVILSKSIMARDNWSHEKPLEEIDSQPCKAKVWQRSRAEQRDSNRSITKRTINILKKTNLFFKACRILLLSLFSNSLQNIGRGSNIEKMKSFHSD